MNKALNCAVGLLSRREHSAFELLHKLMQKGFDEVEANDALVECQRLGFQSDVRFAESLCRTRIQQGHGPMRIERDLRQVQIKSDLIEDILEQYNWVELAQKVWLKKYKQYDETYAIVQKQKQFLLYRGFPMDIIASVFKEIRT